MKKCPSRIVLPIDQPYDNDLVIECQLLHPLVTPENKNHFAQLTSREGREVYIRWVEEITTPITTVEVV